MSTSSSPVSAPFRYLALLLALAAVPGVQAEDLSKYSGAQLFQRFCASCHGKAGKGDGAVAPYFKLLPPDLTRITRRSRGTFPAERIRRVIDGRENVPPHGAREMPVWGTEFTAAAPDPASARATADANIALLVEYLRSIQE